MHLGLFETRGENKILTCRESLQPNFHFADCNYEDWSFNSGNYLFTTDTK